MRGLKDAFKTISPFMGRKNMAKMEQLVNDNMQLRQSVSNMRVDLAELTKQGTAAQQNVMANYLGDYNPDEIPIRTYQRMRWDGQLRLGLMTIKLPIMSRDFWVEGENKEINAFVYQNLKKLWRSLVKSMLTGLDFGHADHEKVWQAAENYRVRDKKENIDYTRDMFIYKSIKDLSPDTITLAYDDKMKFKGFYQNKDNPGKEVYVPKEKAFIFTHDKEWGNLYGWSRMKAAYPYWYTYWIVDAWHERWLQKRGVAPIIVEHPSGQTQMATSGTVPTMKDNAEIARNVGESLQPDTVTTIPSDTIETPGGKKGAWNIHTMEDKTKPGAFIQAKEALDVRKLRSILIPERAITQDTNVGSLGVSSQHVWILMESLKGLIGNMADHINEFIVPQMVINNFGSNAPIPEVFIEEIGRELTASLFEIYKTVLATGEAHPGIRKMEEILNIPAETDEEKEEREMREKEFGIVGRGAGQAAPAGAPAVPGARPMQPKKQNAFSVKQGDRARKLSERVRLNV